MLAGIRISIFGECEYLLVEGLAMAFGGMVGDGIPGLQTLGILRVLGLGSDRIPETPLLPGVSGEYKSESTSIPTKNEVCALCRARVRS